MAFQRPRKRRRTLCRSKVSSETEPFARANDRPSHRKRGGGDHKQGLNKQKHNRKNNAASDFSNELKVYQNQSRQHCFPGSVGVSSENNNLSTFLPPKKATLSWLGPFVLPFFSFKAPWALAELRSSIDRILFEAQGSPGRIGVGSGECFHCCFFFFFFFFFFEVLVDVISYKGFSMECSCGCSMNCEILIFRVFSWLTLVILFMPLGLSLEAFQRDCFVIFCGHFRGNSKCALSSLLCFLVVSML